MLKAGMVSRLGESSAGQLGRAMMFRLSRSSSTKVIVVPILETGDTCCDADFSVKEQLSLDDAFGGLNIHGTHVDNDALLGWDGHFFIEDIQSSMMLHGCLRRAGFVC